MGAISAVDSHADHFSYLVANRDQPTEPQGDEKPKLSERDGSRLVRIPVDELGQRMQV